MYRCTHVTEGTWTRDTNCSNDMKEKNKHVIDLHLVDTLVCAHTVFTVFRVTMMQPHTAMIKKNNRPPPPPQTVHEHSQIAV